MKFRRFTPAGITAVRDFLAKAKESSTLDLAARDRLLSAEARSESGQPLSEPVTELADLDLDSTRIFPTTYAFCEYFHSLIKDHNPLAYRNDVGMWTWLAMVYVDQLVHVDDGIVDCGMEGRIIYLARRYTRDYRHLLAAPYYVFLNYSGRLEDCEAVVAHPLNAPGDFVDQILTRQYLVQNPCVMRCIAVLYLDGEPKVLKTGATASIRRFISVHDQLSLTRDFYEIEDSSALIRMLPREFNRFKQGI